MVFWDEITSSFALFANPVVVETVIAQSIFAGLDLQVRVSSYFAVLHGHQVQASVFREVQEKSVFTFVAAEVVFLAVGTPFV